MSTFGILIGIASLLIIGLGFPLVIMGERYLGYVWWPYMLGIGLSLLAGSLFIPADWLSALTGVLGATFAWGSTELYIQSRRVDAGWFPQHLKKIDPPCAQAIKKWKAPRL